MWLVLPPTICSQSVQASEGLTSLSQSQSEMLAQSVTSRGKPKPPQTWQRAWKTGRYMRRLSGLTCPPSTANLGVEQWIASLVATRASQIPSPDHVLDPMMTASLSTNLFGSSKKCGLSVSFAKTSQGMRTDSSQPLSQLSKGWATALRLEYSQRAKWGLPIDASGCSSWATPQARDYRSGEGHRFNNPDRSKNLNDQVDKWPTPTVRDHKGSSPDSIIRNDGKSRMSQLDTKAEQGFHTSPQVQTTQDGQKSSKNTPRLNPLFVQWMMGWPIGWTNYDRPVTGFAQWLEQSRGYLCQLILNKHDQ